MLMAIQRPQYFEKLILLDPVLLPKRYLWILRVLNLFSLGDLPPLPRSANGRRWHFESLDAAGEHYGKKRVFQRWAPGFLDAYVSHCLRTTHNGSVQLACDRGLESSIYQSVPLNAWSLPRQLTQPTLFLIGKHSDTVNARGQRRLQRQPGNHIVKEVNGGHLFPFENPEETMTLIKDFLS